MKKLLTIFAFVLISSVAHSQNLPCPDFVCESDVNLVTYTVPNTVGSTYTWTVVGGGLVGGQGTNTAQVDWFGTPVGVYLVEVFETDANGCDGDPVSCMVTITPIPVTGSITHD
jgi:hypothetical protein|tara:strand:+ start:457 stop:798 length:342 start_codon:yes stop_codon:yes gene_type:complete